MERQLTLFDPPAFEPEEYGVEYDSVWEEIFKKFLNKELLKRVMKIKRRKWGWLAPFLYRGKTKKNKLVFFVLKWDGRKFCIMQQNKGKRSRWANLAQAGHRVWQVFFTYNIENPYPRGWIGVIVDGKFYRYKR